MRYNCKCVPVLLSGGYLTTAISIVFDKGGKTESQIVLPKLKEGKNGRLSVIPAWYLVQYCPNCGKPIRQSAKEVAHLSPT